MNEERKIEIEQVDSVETPPRATVAEGGTAFRGDAVAARRSQGAGVAGPLALSSGVFRLQGGCHRVRVGKLTRLVDGHTFRA